MLKRKRQVTREEAHDILSIVCAKRIRIKNIEEKISKARFFCTSEIELRRRISDIEDELIAMQGQKREAMKTLGGY